MFSSTSTWPSEFVVRHFLCAVCPLLRLRTIHPLLLREYRALALVSQNLPSETIATHGFTKFASKLPMGAQEAAPSAPQQGGAPCGRLAYDILHVIFYTKEILHFAKHMIANTITEPPQGFAIRLAKCSRNFRTLFS